MMKNYDQSVEINHNLNWPFIPDYNYKILITGSSRFGKTNVLLNLIKKQWPDIDKSYLHVKDQFKSKYWNQSKGRERVGIKKLKTLKAFIDYSQVIDNVYWYFEDCNLIWRLLIVFDDMEMQNLIQNKILLLLNYFWEEENSTFY